MMRMHALKRDTLPKGNVRSLGPILRYLKPYRWYAVGAALAVLVASSSVLGIGSGLRYLIDEGLNKGNKALLDRAFMILAATVLLLAVATYARFFLVSTLGELLVRDIRNAVYKRLISMHIGFYENTRTGDLMSRLTVDTNVLQGVIGSSLSIAVRNILLLLGGFTMLLMTNARLTEYVLVLVPLVVAPILLLGKRVRAAARESQMKVADISAQAEESLNAIRTLQALALEPYQEARFGAHVEGAMQAAQKRIRLRAALTAIVIMLVFGAVVMVLWLGGQDVLDGTITTGQLSAFVFYSVIVAGAVGAISEVWADVQRAAGAAERISELLGYAPEITSPAHPRPLTQQGGAQVRFEQVHFTYPMRRDRAAITDFSLVVEPGQSVAFVGPSGAGKTTLFQLMLRFYDPSAGRICVDGIDIRELALPQLRRTIGLVPQEPVIFSDTARENIRVGNTEASDDEIVAAARAASAMEFLEQLPQGLDTFVGEKGVQLSGGQRQRIAIARALVRNPRLLLLDEATSALDSENEHLIQQALNRLVQGRTTFIIAHRLSTIMRADRIVLLNQGRMEASGTHQELLKNSELYARLAALQFRESE